MELLLIITLISTPGLTSIQCCAQLTTLLNSSEAFHLYLLCDVTGPKFCSLLIIGPFFISYEHFLFYADLLSKYFKILILFNAMSPVSVFNFCSINARLLYTFLYCLL